MVHNVPFLCTVLCCNQLYKHEQSSLPMMAMVSGVSTLFADTKQENSIVEDKGGPQMHMDINSTSSAFIQSWYWNKKLLCSLSRLY